MITYLSQRLIRRSFGSEYARKVFLLLPLVLILFSEFFPLTALAGDASAMIFRGIFLEEERLPEFPGSLIPMSYQKAILRSQIKAQNGEARDSC